MKNLDKLPDPKLHQIISFVKSGIRIGAAVTLLVVSEAVGIIEELV